MGQPPQGGVMCSDELPGEVSNFDDRMKTHTPLRPTPLDDDSDSLIASDLPKNNEEQFLIKI